MLSKTFAAAALVASAAAYSASDLPACWSDCFAKFQAEESCLCSDSIGKVVSHCIAKGCDSASNEAYVEWLSGYCTSGQVPSSVSNTWAPPATPPTYPASTAPPAPASYPPAGTAPPAPASYPAPSGGAPPAPSGYPSVASAPPPYPYGTHSGSVCVETSTLIWRSSTSVTTYSVTATGGWAYPSGAPGAPSGTGAWAPTGSAPPVPYTGGAVSSFKAATAAGLAIFVGAAALIL